MKQQRLDRVETLKVYEFLKTILTKNADGTCSYHDDWTDERVAAAFDTGRRAVENVRRASFGSLYAPPKASKAGADPELVSRVESLERRFISQQSTIESLVRTLERQQRMIDDATTRLNLFYAKLASLLD